VRVFIEASSLKRTVSAGRRAAIYAFCQPAPREVGARGRDVGRCEKLLMLSGAASVPRAEHALKMCRGQATKFRDEILGNKTRTFGFCFCGLRWRGLLPAAVLGK